MHVGAARMRGPNAGFALQHWGLEGVVLLNAQITHRVAGLVQGAYQLRLVVEESLAPLRMAGSHGQHPALQRSGAAVRCQLRARNSRPVLP